jgi:ribosomal protein L19
MAIIIKIDKKKKNNVYDNIIKTGAVLYIKYLLLKEDEIKISSFIGLCVIKKKKSNTLVLKNNIKKENIKLVINAHSPLIINIKIIKRYKKKFRLSKLYFK